MGGTSKMNTIINKEFDVVITLSQARRFMLLKQGLMGMHKFHGKDGILAFVRQAGCIQFDPIDVCGKNAELVLQSRIQGVTKEMLYQLLYEDRVLVDYFDKNLAIMDVHDWKYFERIRQSYRTSSKGHEAVNLVEEQIKALIKAHGPLSSKELSKHEALDGKIDWYWSETKLSRAALETLYFRGDLIVHHKKGTNKYYGLAEEHLPSNVLSEQDPHDMEIDHLKWRVLRRISAVGMMWNKPSDAWLYIWGLKSAQRNQIFKELLEASSIVEIRIEGFKEGFYIVAEDLPMLSEIVESDSEDLRTEQLAEAKSNKISMLLKNKNRTELIAPLDSFIWDRKLIKAIFGFEYTWEIYKPEVERVYGYYVLPLLSEERFIGRVEVLSQKKTKTLYVKNIWLESDVKWTKQRQKNVEKCFEKFKGFHDLEAIAYSEAVCKRYYNSEPLSAKTIINF